MRVQYLAGGTAEISTVVAKSAMAPQAIENK
jgi:hypothetical protein